MRQAFVLLIFIGLFGCASLEPVAMPKVSTYQLNILPANNTCISKNKDVLQVNQMLALSPFNTNKILYSTINNELSTYSYHQWSSAPNEMLSNNIVQYLNAQCIYANVTNANFVTNAQYRLNTQLIRLSLDTVNNKTSVNLIIMAQLVDNKTNYIIKTKIFNLNQPSKNTPIAMVNISNELELQFLQDLTKWIAPSESIK